MQLLTFTIASDTYAIESRRVIEVVPLVPSRPVPRAPHYVRGVFVYRGRLLPLIDLGQRLADTAPRDRLGTRVIVVDCNPVDGSTTVRLGLVADNVLSICSTSAADSSLPPLRSDDAACLGPLLRIDGGTIQVLAVDRLLPRDVAASLTAATPCVTAPPAASLEPRPLPRDPASPLP